MILSWKWAADKTGQFGDAGGAVQNARFDILVKLAMDTKTIATVEDFRFWLEADCWMSGQCWMTMTPNNIRLEVKTLISFIGCHPTISVYNLKL